MPHTIRGAQIVLKDVERKIKRVGQEFERRARLWEREHGFRRGYLSSGLLSRDEHPLKDLIGQEQALRKRRDDLRSQTIEVGDQVLVNDHKSPYHQHAGILRERRDDGAVVTVTTGKRKRNVLFAWARIEPYSDERVQEWLMLNRVSSVMAEVFSNPTVLNA